METIETNKTTRTDMYNVDPRAVIFDPKDNPRKDYGDMESLKNFITENGVKFLPAIKVKKITVDGEDRYELKHGFRRMTAFMELISEGVEIARIKAELVDKHYGVENEILDHFSQNSGKPLTVYEEAIIFKQLEDYGWTQTEIAKKLGVTPASVSNKIKVASIQKKAIHDALSDGTITTTTVLKVMQKYSDHDKAEHVILEAIKNMKAVGKTKVTDKSITETETQTVVAPKISKYQRVMVEVLSRVVKQQNLEQIEKLNKVKCIIDILDTIKDADELAIKLVEVL
jgi:ParB/RepB/Spo0J family partition protein